MASEYSSTVGAIGVAVAILAWGCFMVPTKVQRVQRANVSPLVMQTYLSVAIFITSFLTLTFKPWVFTWWGVLAACLWTPGNFLAVTAVRILGVGLAQSSWAGLIVIVSFLWGFAGTSIWDDPKCTLDNTPLAVVGLVLLIVGIGGLGWFAAPKPSTAAVRVPPVRVVDDDLLASYSDLTASKAHPQSPLPAPDAHSPPSSPRFAAVSAGGGGDSDLSPASEVLLSPQVLKEGVNPPSAEPYAPKYVGVVCVVAVALLAGSIMVPLKLANNDGVEGMEYVPSFGIGVAFATAVVVLGASAYNRRLPKPHVRVAAAPGLFAGVLWNIGNVGSLLASLSPLGQTAGYPLCQAALLIGSLFGVFMFKEVRGTRAITGFVFSGVVVVAGAVLLGDYGSCKQA